MKIKVEIQFIGKSGIQTNRTAECEFATNDSTAEIEKIAEFTKLSVSKLIDALSAEPK